MSLESLIDTYGYVAILVGTFFEGETILVLGGFAAHRGYLDLPGVILAAFVGTLLGDQLFFVLGRRHSEKILAKRPSWKRRVKKAQDRVRRFRIPFLIGFRFLYGLRSVTPFVVGMSDVPAPLFVFLNALGAMVWAIAVGIGGYLFGNVLEIFIENAKRYEVYAFITIAAGGAVIWIIQTAIRRRLGAHSKRSEQEQDPL